MGVEYYSGVEGACITVESAEDLYEALDYLHTKVMDNISETSPLLQVLEQAMNTIMIDYGVEI